ncbi:DNA circularization N-terminal domain-containing protein [Cohnella faecalis]|uniref:DNA circulation N-terminal domain-containing protein n=1 Tax=Cohnella faecalis TaxID=2315694 RepID=A0A398CJE0_9BACL|nr:DNA circularization N-terminal domain-containing protein [Cohnella faecalis]RIE02440.1 hypothetical protein D3H35_17195 [Cohnella faecalis]
MPCGTASGLRGEAVSAANAVVIGTVELDKVTGILVEEKRKLAVHPWPGSTGDLIQDLGMAAARIRIYGIVSGDGAGDKLEQLRALINKGDSVDFTASAAIPSDVTQVMIVSCQVYQPPGFVNLFEYELELIRYVPVPVTDSGGFHIGSLSSLKDSMHSSALDEISGAVSELGTAKGRLQDIEDVMSATKDSLSLLKNGMNLFSGLNVLRKVISTGQEVVEASKK